MAVPVLDVSAGFTDGDQIKIIDALDLGFSESTLSGLVTCMNQMSSLSPDMVATVVAYLTRWETAQTTKTAADVANTENKTLVKADVLEWEASGAKLTGLESEIATCVAGIMNAFSFCPYVNKGHGGFGQAQLLRS